MTITRPSVDHLATLQDWIAVNPKVPTYKLAAEIVRSGMSSIHWHGWGGLPGRLALRRAVRAKLVRWVGENGVQAN